LGVGVGESKIFFGKVGHGGVKFLKTSQGIHANIFIFLFILFSAQVEFILGRVYLNLFSVDRLR
jgi:hypothetical protein